MDIDVLKQKHRTHMKEDNMKECCHNHIEVEHNVYHVYILWGDQCDECMLWDVKASLEAKFEVS